jgi:HEAT repeat protein
MATLARTRSLPAVEPRRKLPSIKDGSLAAMRSPERGADFWEGVAGFTRREEAFRKDVASSSTSSLRTHKLSSDDMHMLAGMGYKGPLFQSLTIRSTKDLLAQKQATGNLKQFRSAVRAAELNVGFDDPVVKRMRDCLKDADMGIRAVKKDGENMETLAAVMRRVRNLDMGRQVWDDPVLAAGRDRYMTWRVSGLQSPKAETRKASCAALAALGGASSPVQAASLARVQHPASKYASELAALFNDPSYDVRQAAISACVRLGDEGTKVVLAQLESVEPRARRAACQALGNMGEKGAVHAPLVAAKLCDPDSEVRNLACMAFESFGLASFAAPVAARLHDTSVRVRRSSIAALGKMGEAAADFLSDFDELMDDEDEDVRACASEVLRALGEMGQATLHAAEARLAAAAISRKKESSTKEDRLEAIEALSALRENSDTEDAALEYINDVAACFNDENAEVRKAAILAFQGFTSHESAHALADDVAKNLDDEDETIRIAAVNSLMTMNHGNESHLDAVVDLLDDTNNDVRKAVVDAIGNSAGANPSTTRHIMKLAALTQDDSKEMQDAAENALQNMGQGGKAVSSAMRMDHEDENVRLAAIEALSGLNLFKVSEAEQKRRNQDRMFLELPGPRGSEDDDMDDVFGPSPVPRSAVQSQPVSARSRSSQIDPASPLLSRSPMSPKSPLAMRVSPLMVPKISESSSQRVPDKEQEPMSPVSPTSPGTALKFSAARTWRQGALLARAVSGFKKSGAIGSPKMRQDKSQAAEVSTQDEGQTKPLRSVRVSFEEKMVKGENEIDSPKMVDSPKSQFSPKSPFSPKSAWRRGIRSAVAIAKTQEPDEESEASSGLDAEQLREREANEVRQAAFDIQKTRTRTRKTGELGKFLEQYGQGDPFAKEALAAKQGRRASGLTEFSHLDQYLGCPSRVKEYNEILHIAFVSLSSRARDPNHLQRIAACNAFSTFNADTEDIAPLVGPLLYDHLPEVQQAARACLVCIGGSGIDLINKFDKEKRSKKKRGICRFIVDTWIKASPPYIEQWAPREAAFEVGNLNNVNPTLEKAVFFKGSTDDPNAQGKVTQLDMSDGGKQYLLRSDNADYKLTKEEKARIRSEMLKFHH